MKRSIQSTFGQYENIDPWNADSVLYESINLLQNLKSNLSVYELKHKGQHARSKTFKLPVVKSKCPERTNKLSFKTKQSENLLRYNHYSNKKGRYGCNKQNEQTKQPRQLRREVSESLLNRTVFRKQNEVERKGKTLKINEMIFEHDKKCKVRKRDRYLEIFGERHAKVQSIRKCTDS